MNTLWKDLSELPSENTIDIILDTGNVLRRVEILTWEYLFKLIATEYPNVKWANIKDLVEYSKEG